MKVVSLHLSQWSCDTKNEAKRTWRLVLKNNRSRPCVPRSELGLAVNDSRLVCFAGVKCVGPSKLVPVALSFDDPSLTMTLRNCADRPRHWGECRSPRGLFEGTCDVASTSPKLIQRYGEVKQVL